MVPVGQPANISVKESQFCCMVLKKEYFENETENFSHKFRTISPGEK